MKHLTFSLSRSYPLSFAPLPPSNACGTPSCALPFCGGYMDGLMLGLSLDSWVVYAAFSWRGLGLLNNVDSANSILQASNFSSPDALQAAKGTILDKLEGVTCPLCFHCLFCFVLRFPCRSLSDVCSLWIASSEDQESVQCSSGDFNAVPQDPIFVSRLIIRSNLCCQDFGCHR